MKYIKFGALAALAGVGFVACSGDQGAVNEGGTSGVSMKLVTPDGILITEVLYDLNTQDGEDVKNGSIPVPNPDSVANGFIGALPLDDYSLTVSASATYEGQTISCESAAPTLFSLTVPNATTPIGNVNLTCTIQVPVGNDTANVTFTVDVELEEIPVVVNALETFTVAPITAAAAVVGGACDWAPMGINVSNTNPEIVYSWSATPDGTFALNPSNTVGSYECASEGAKTLTVTATYQGVSASIDVPVTCNECEDGVEPCGDGTVGPGEECDNSEPWCVACQIDPVCGDGELHEVGTCAACDEECDDGDLEDGDGCSSTCDIEEPTCDAGEELCGTVCVDTQTDPANCGACGTACDTAAGESCVAGVCEEEAGDPLAACIECINTVSAAGDFNQTVCEADPLCTDVRDCVLTAVPANPASGSCFTPIAASCYCGELGDYSACEEPAYDPVGACSDQIIAGHEAGISNAEILARYSSFDYPAGQAMAIVEEARVSCSSVCTALSTGL